MFFPISDDDRHLMHPAWVTIGLVVMNVVLFLWQQLNPEFTLGWSVIPYELTHAVDLDRPVVAQIGSEYLRFPWPRGLRRSI